MVELQDRVWTGAENLAPTGIRSPDRRVRSESLYQLRYSGPTFFVFQSYLTAFPFAVVFQNSTMFTIFVRRGKERGHLSLS
jgi:hypothetical protein